MTANILAAVSRNLNTWAERSLFVLGVSMAAIVAAQVFSRYVLNHSLFWSEELARYILVWLSFLGATVAYRRGANPGVDVLYSRLPEGPRRASAAVVHLVSLGMFGVMAWYGTAFAHFIRFQISPALSLPKWLPVSVIALSGAIMAVHALYFLAVELGHGSGPEDGQEVAR